MKENRNSIKSSLLLLLTATIWGIAFVAQSVGMDYVGPLTFNGVRFLIGAAVLLPFILWREKQQKRKEQIENTTDEEKKADRRLLLTGGICCGAALCFASLFQQLGIMHTSVGKAGFITTLYIIIVPILGIFLHKKIGIKIWIGAVIAVVGMFLLCISESFSLSKGDALVLICAILFSFHILVVDYFSPRTDGVKLSCIQFAVSGFICIVLAFIFEEPSLQALVDGAVPILYAGILSCGVAYTLQVIGQKDVDPTIASLIMSLESVISVLAGWVLLNQKLSKRELLGCALVFLAVILVQLPERNKKSV